VRYGDIGGGGTTAAAAVGAAVGAGACHGPVVVPLLKAEPPLTEPGGGQIRGTRPFITAGIAGLAVTVTTAGAAGAGATPTPAAGPASIRVTRVSRIPGTAEQIAAGVVHAAGEPGKDVVGVILQYS